MLIKSLDHFSRFLFQREQEIQHQAGIDISCSTHLNYLIEQEASNCTATSRSLLWVILILEEPTGLTSLSTCITLSFSSKSCLQYVAQPKHLRPPLPYSSSSSFPLHFFPADPNQPCNLDTANKHQVQRQSEIKATGRSNPLLIQRLSSCFVTAV